MLLSSNWSHFFYLFTFSTYPGNFYFVNIEHGDSKKYSCMVLNAFMYSANADKGNKVVVEGSDTGSARFKYTNLTSIN